jgi:Rha family phage regulatory protein
MKLVFSENNRLITDSLVMAEAFGKSHDNVMRDIRQQIEKLNEAGLANWSVINFEETHYQHPQNKQWYPKFNLTEEGFAIVAMAYITPEAMKMKVKFLGEFKRMSEELNKPKFNIPQTYTEALRLAADLSEENERVTQQNHQLLLQATQQEEQLKLQEPRVAFANLVIAAGNTQPMGTVAKAVGMGRNNLFKFLREKGIIMKNSTIPYQQFIDRGYFVVREVPTKRGDDQIINEPTARVTAKGLEYIAKLVIDNKGA